MRRIKTGGGRGMEVRAVSVGDNCKEWSNKPGASQEESITDLSCSG